MTSTQCTEHSGQANFHLISSSEDDDDDTHSVIYPALASPIFKPKRRPTATVSKPPAAGSESPRPSTSGVNIPETKTENLVGYNDSVCDKAEIIDITGLSSDNKQCFKNPVSDTELQSLSGKTFAASRTERLLGQRSFLRTGNMPETSSMRGDKFVSILSQKMSTNLSYAQPFVNF